MYRRVELANETRVAIAGLTALAGAATAWAVSVFGSRILHMLPENGFHLAAFLGAGIAGFVLADGFGRPGLWGFSRAAITAGLATLAGAWLGAVLITPPGEAWFSVGILGWIMLADAVAADIAIPKIWAAAMVGLHLIAMQLRFRAAAVSP